MVIQTSLAPQPRYTYRLVSDAQAVIIRQLYAKYSLTELARWLPLSYPTVKAIVRERDAYSASRPDVPNCLSVQEALMTYFGVKA